MIYSLVLVNKPVINSDKNEKVGKVKKYVVDPETKKVVAFILVPEPGQSALDIVPYANVKSVYNNAVIIENMPTLIKMSEAPEVLNTFMKDIPVIGSQVLTDTGMLAGTVRDFAFREKDGALVRLALSPDKDGPARIHAKHIITIAKSRIIISALALREEPTDEEPEEEQLLYVNDDERGADSPAPAATSAPSAPAGASAATSSSAPTVKETPRPKREVEDSVVYAKAGPAMYSRSPGDGASIQEVKAVMREMFAEMTEALLPRLGMLVARENLNEAKKEIMEAVNASVAKQANETPSLEILVEDKIKRGAGRHLEEIKETLAGLNKSLAEGADERSRLGAKLGEISAAIGALEGNATAAIKEAVGESRPEIDVEEVAARVAGIVEKSIREIESALPKKEELAQIVREFGGRQEERANSLIAAAKSELDRHAEMLGLNSEGGALLRSEEARSLLEEMKAGIAGALESSSSKGRLEELAAELKATAEKLGGGLEDVKSAVSSGGETANVLKAEIESLRGSVSAGLAELREGGAGLKDALIEEIKSFAESGMKPGDLDVVRRWIGEIKEGDRAESILEALRDLSGSLEERASRAAETLNHSLGELRDERAAAARDAEARAAAALEEVKTTLAGALKMEDLDVVRRWISEIKEGDQTGAILEEVRGLGGALEEKVSGALEQGTAGAARIAEAISEKLDSKISEISEATLKAGSETEKIIEDLSNAIDGLKTGILDNRQEISALRDSLAARIDEFAHKIQQTAGAVESAIAGAMEKAGGGAVSIEELRELKDSTTSSLNQFRDAFVVEMESKVSRIITAQEERLEPLKDAMELMAGKAATIPEIIAGGLRDEIAAGIANSQRGIFEEILALIDNRFGGLAGASDIEQLRSRIDSAVSEVAGKASEGAAAREDVRELLENSLAGIMEEIKSQFGRREGIIDEIKGRLERGESKAALDIESLREHFEKSVAPMVEGVRAAIDSRLENVAGMSDLESSRQRIEQKFGDATDRLVERIEKRLDERDEELGKGLQSILKKIEKMLQGGVKTEASEGIFGGGFLSAIFGAGRGGGSAVEEAPAMKIQSRTERPAASARFSKGSDILEENHIKRLAYLIGKKLRQDVSDPHGNLLASEGDIVDEDMIKRLRDAHCTLPLIRSVDFGD